MLLSIIYTCVKRVNIFRIFVYVCVEYVLMKNMNIFDFYYDVNFIY